MEETLRRAVALATVVIVLLGVFALDSLGRTSCELRIPVPAGSQDTYAFCDQEVSSSKSIITVSAGDGLGDTMVILERVDGAGGSETYLTPGMPVEIEVEPYTWYRIGVARQNPTDEDQEAVVAIEGNLELRIE